MASKFFDRFEKTLRERAPRACPWLDADRECLANLLRAIDADLLAAAFAELVEESLGPGHTLYEIIAGFGVDKSAQFLHARAAPTCHFGSRDIEAFNFDPLNLTIVCLPEAVGPRDPDIRTALKAAFEKLGDCTFTVGPSTQRTVSVVRVYAGWCIGIEQANQALLQRYVRSGESGHTPHLLGLVTDSLLGEVSPRNAMLMA